jgi:hypothetical protein
VPQGRRLSKGSNATHREGEELPRDRGAVADEARAREVGTLGKRASRVLAAYIASLPFDLHPAMPIFHTCGGQPGPKGGRPRPTSPIRLAVISAKWARSSFPATTAW